MSVMPFGAGQAEIADGALIGRMQSTRRGQRAAVNSSLQQHSASYAQDDGSDVVAATVPLYVAAGDGELSSIKAWSPDAPSGGTPGATNITVDLQQSTGGGAFATILSGVITIDSTEADFVPVDGAFASISYVAGDVFQLVIAVTAGDGTQGQGLNVTTKFNEEPVDD